MTMTKACVKFVVSGVVQGVGFRFHTCHEGNKRGLTGYSKNLINGDVEVVACGEFELVESLHEWLKKGPRTSVVNNITSENIEFQAFQGFKTIY